MFYKKISHNIYQSNFGYILDEKINFNELKFTNIYFNFLMQFTSTTLHFDLPFTNFNSINEVNNYIMDWVENDNKLRDKTILYNLISRFNDILKESKINTMDVYYRILFRYSIIEQIFMKLKKDFDVFMEKHTQNDNSIKNIGLMYLDFYELILKTKTDLSNNSIINNITHIGDNWFETLRYSFNDLPIKIENLFKNLYDIITNISNKNLQQIDLLDLDYKYFVKYDVFKIIDITHIYLTYYDRITKKKDNVFIKKLETYRN